jgi:hypothetical protein
MIRKLGMRLTEGEEYIYLIILTNKQFLRSFPTFNLWNIFFPSSFQNYHWVYNVLFL